MNPQFESGFYTQPSLPFDISTLKQRRFQYKSIRKFFGYNSHGCSPNIIFSLPSLIGVPEALDPFTALRYLAPESNRTEYMYHSNGQSYAYNNPLSTSNIEEGRFADHAPVQKRMLTDPSNPANFMSPPRRTVDLSKSMNTQLTPLRISSDKIFFTPRDLMLSHRSQRGPEVLENLGFDTPSLHLLKRSAMTPDAKRHSASAVLHKDLLSYRAARQIVKNPLELNTIRSQSFREVSKSQDSNRFGAINYSIDSELARNLIDSERKESIIGLEKFYKKNLEVLEEDESPSEELERKNESGALEFMTFDKVKKEIPFTNLKDKRKETREASASKAHQKEINGEKNIGSSGVNDKVEQYKVEKRLLKDKPSTPMKISRLDKKRDSRESCDLKPKTVSKDTKKGQSITTRPTEESQRQRILKEEEDIKTYTGIYDESNRERNPGLSITIGPQGTHLTSNIKKLQLNNWAKTLHLGSAGASNRTSPKSRSRDLPSALTMKKTESPKKRTTEHKSASNLRGSTIAQIINRGSKLDNGIIDDIEIVASGLIGGNLSKTPVIEVNKEGVPVNTGVPKKEQSEKKVEVKNLKLPLHKDNRSKGDLSGTRVDTSESERIVNKVVPKDRDISNGKQGSATRESTKRRESYLKPISDNVEQPRESSAGTYQPSKKSSITMKKLPNEIVNNSSPKNRRPKEDEKANQAKEIVDKLKDKTPMRGNLNNGISGHLSRKSTEPSLSSSNMSGAVPSMVSKLKSPTGQLSKSGTLKIGEALKDKKMGINKLKDYKEARLMKSSKEIRSSKNSREWKNLSEYKLATSSLEDKSKNNGTSISTTQKISGLSIIERLETITSENTKPIEQINQEQTDKKGEMENGENERKSTERDSKVETSEQTKIKQAIKNPSNLKISSSLLFKSLGMSFASNKNGKSHLQVLVGEAIKNKHKEK